jgi:hypothetical protein
VQTLIDIGAAPYHLTFFLSRNVLEGPMPRTEGPNVKALYNFLLDAAEMDVKFLRARMGDPKKPLLRLGKYAQLLEQLSPHVQRTPNGRS